MRHESSLFFGTLPLIYVVAALGCGSSDSESTPSAGCPYPIGDVCAGVPADPVCAADACTDGVACTKILSANPEQLASVAAGAAAGSCIALAPGEYGAVTLPGGVSLLGKGAGFVTVAGVTLGGGQGALVRGVTIGAGGMQVKGAKGVKVDRVRIAKASADGLDIQSGGEVSLTHCEVTDATDVGVRATDAAGVTIDASVVVGGAGPGVAALCTGGCMCASPPIVTVTRSILRENAHVGLFLSGVHATVTTVAVENTRVRALETNSGGGVVAAACTDVSATGLSIESSAFFGMLVDNSHAKLGQPGEVNGIIIHANVLGLWMQGKDLTGELTNVKVTDNEGVGVAAAGEANGIIIHASEIRGTATKTLVVTDGGSKEVGDGLLWTAQSKLQVDGLKVSDSARQPILIDGSVATGSSLANVSLEGADAGKGILQQSFMPGGVAPAVGASVPMIASVGNQKFQLPVPPVAPKP